MLQLEIIGNLGADAQVMTSNGKPFVSFNVAHTERWQGEDGVKHEQTQWVSGALNGDGGNLLQYLKKGTTVSNITSTTANEDHLDQSTMLSTDFRFHAVEPFLWYSVGKFIDTLLMQRLNSGHDRLVINLDATMWQNLMTFREQMDTAYLHPRRDAMHLRYINHRYGQGATLAANEKKPKSNHKAR